MDKFVEDLGFRIADNLSVAIAIGVVAAIAGVLLAYQALRHDDDLREYRFLAVILGLALTATVAFGMPYAHRRAGQACDRWAASADTIDELRYLSHSCDEHF